MDSKALSLTKYENLFEEKLECYHEKIQRRVTLIIQKQNKAGFSRKQLFKKLLKYTKNEKFTENDVVDLFLFKYDIERKPYVTGVYLKEREKLLKIISPYDILRLEDTNKNFPEVYLKFGKNQPERFLKILDMVYEFERPIFKVERLASDEKWYKLTDYQFDEVINTLKTSPTEVTPQIIKKVLHLMP